MKCNKQRMCKNLVYSSSITVVGTTLVINVAELPLRKGCLAIAQPIPDAATVNMPVVITVGTDATQYPLVDMCGVQLSASELCVRDIFKYSFIAANTQSIFKLCEYKRSCSALLPTTVV